MASRLKTESSGYRPYTPSDAAVLRRTLEPGDILLIEGNQRISAVIKYLTQSTWSHSALYVGDALPEPEDGSDRPRLIEVNLGDGCIAVPLSKYRTYNTSICRARNLTPEDSAQVVDFMVAHLGLKYDMKNIFDMLRYFLPTPPVPVRWRRRMLAFGSGDPTRSICSTLIAEAFEGIRYPILPEITRRPVMQRRNPTIPGRKSCISATILSTRRATSTCRHISRSSSRRWNTVSTTRR